MERILHRADYQNGKLTIEITDAAHLIDSVNYARSQNQEIAFERAIFRLIRMALGAAIPQREFAYEGKMIAAVPGRERKLRISPDSLTEPSFFWKEDKGIHGGLIYHKDATGWSIHT